MISSFHLIRDYYVLPDMGVAADAAAGMSDGLLKGLWGLHSVSSSGFTKLAVEFCSSDCLYFVFLNLSVYRYCFCPAPGLFFPHHCSSAGVSFNFTCLITHLIYVFTYFLFK